MQRLTVIQQELFQNKILIKLSEETKEQVKTLLSELIVDFWKEENILWAKEEDKGNE